MSFFHGKASSIYTREWTKDSRLTKYYRSEKHHAYQPHQDDINKKHIPLRVANANSPLRTPRLHPRSLLFFLPPPRQGSVLHQCETVNLVALCPGSIRHVTTIIISLHTFTFKIKTRHISPGILEEIESGVCKADTHNYSLNLTEPLDRDCTY